MIAWIACSLPVMQLLYFVMSKDQSVDINEENNDTFTICYYRVD